MKISCQREDKVLVNRKMFMWNPIILKDLKDKSKGENLYKLIILSKKCHFKMHIVQF